MEAVGELLRHWSFYQTCCRPRLQTNHSCAQRPVRFLDRRFHPSMRHKSWKVSGQGPARGGDLKSQDEVRQMEGDGQKQGLLRRVRQGSRAALGDSITDGSDMPACIA